MKTKTRASGEPQTAADFNLGPEGDVSFEGTDYPILRRNDAEPQLWGETLGDRAIDILFTLILAIVFAPIMIGVVVVLAYSGDPIIFRQTRLGRNGRTFQVYKFRTMVPNAEGMLKSMLERDPALRQEWQQGFKLKEDPRVTLIGRFLRRTSLDELPQIWNILIGDMSLVGPRPVAPGEITQYGRYAKYYYAQRPGLTGLWQVSGRSNASYSRRIVLDAFYSRNRSFRLDLRIIFKTALIVLKGQGAY